MFYIKKTKIKNMNGEVFVLQTDGHIEYGFLFFWGLRNDNRIFSTILPKTDK